VVLAQSHKPGTGAATPPVSNSAPATSPPGSTAPPSSAAAVTEQQAAQNLAGLLASSASDRGAINSAYNDVMACGPSLTQDQATFQQAVSSRQQLLSQLNSLPGRSALPASMVSSLQQGWQASISADQDFAAWAQDESSNCTPDDTADSNYQAANGPDQQATQFKTAFVNAWNPLATQYGLTQYQQAQL
jgi:hypothetical protein